MAHLSENSAADFASLIKEHGGSHWNVPPVSRHSQLPESMETEVPASYFQAFSINQLPCGSCNGEQDILSPFRASQPLNKPTTESLQKIISSKLNRNWIVDKI